MSFLYASDYERRKTVLKKKDDVINTRFYMGDYEINVKDGATQYIHYISGGDGLCAIVVKEEKNGFNYYFPYTDHLGSILTVTDKSGVVVAEQNFDAWGRKRNADKWDYANVGKVPAWLYRGYTGHEHLPEFGLINMNARLYDPVLGRMLSADNVIGGNGTQGFNRYSYAHNNPLKFVDPDGNFAWFVVVGAAFGAYAGASIQSGSVNPKEWKSDAWKGAIVGAFIGAGVGSAVAQVAGASGITTTAGVTKAFGITSSTIQGANLGMAISAITWNGDGNLSDILWKSGVVGAATSAFSATGGFGMAKAWGSKNAAAQFIGRLGYQGIGSAGQSIGQNWVSGKHVFSKVVVGIGPVNLTLGKGQQLFQWQDNVGNILANANGLAILATGGHFTFNWKHLTPIYEGGYYNKLGGGGFSPYVITASDGFVTDNASDLAHEEHHVWQSRSLGSYGFIQAFIGQAFTGLSLNGFKLSGRPKIVLQFHHIIITKQYLIYTDDGNEKISIIFNCCALVHGVRQEDYAIN